jgi:hypothetical protein
MASTDREKLRRALLLAFVTASVILICLIWIEGLQGPGDATPSYSRGTYKVDESIYLTVTAEAVEFEQQLTKTPRPSDWTPEHQENGLGQGGGRGQGRGQGTGNGSP